MKRLTDKDRLFCFEMIADAKMNPEKAALKAGYSDTVARTKAYLWVSNSKQNPKPQVREFLDSLLKTKETNLELTAKRVEDELCKLGFSNLADIIDKMGGRINLHLLKNLSEAERCAISEISETEKDGVITRTIKMHPKTRPLEILLKRVSVRGKDRTIIVNIIKDGKVIEENRTQSGIESGT